MKRLATACLIAATCLVAATAAQAGAIYRCGPNQFSETPCPGGTVVSATGASNPTAEQLRQANEVAQRESKLADTLHKDREALERRTQGQHAGSLSPTSAASQAKDHGTHKPKKKAHKSSDHASDHDRKPDTKSRRGGAQPDGSFKAISPAPAKPHKPAKRSAPPASAA